VAEKTAENAPKLGPDGKVYLPVSKISSAGAYNGMLC